MFWTGTPERRDDSSVWTCVGLSARRDVGYLGLADVARSIDRRSPPPTKTMKRMSGVYMRCICEAWASLGSEAVHNNEVNDTTTTHAARFLVRV